jgi:hypothetical protein
MGTEYEIQMYTVTTGISMATIFLVAKYEVIHFRVFTIFDINAINEIPKW